MNDEEARQWNFQLNIVGLTLLLFAAGYIGQHLALLMPVSGWGQVAAHYLGELVLTIVAAITALSRAYGSHSQQRHRIAWLERSAVWLYIGVGAVLLNQGLLTAALLLNRLK
ncbi:MAG: hypothetical protein JNM56_15845 [Planctomycetia bacterium]|nr:hypothetical protein [Planctomycetia bacterium]